MTSDDPTKKNQSPDDRNGAPANDSQAAPQLLPAAQVAPIQVPPTPYHCQITYKTKKDWRDKVKFWAELVGLFFLIVYTLATIGYLYMGVRQWREMIAVRHQAQGAIDAANRSAGAAEEANTEAKNRFIVDQRPYVWTTDPDLTRHPEGGEPGPRFKIGSKVWWQIYYQNYGKTPAIGVNQRHQLEFGPNALQKLRRSKVSPVHTNGDHSGSILAPGQVMFMTATSKREATAKDYQFIVLDNTTAHPRYRENSMAVLVHFEYFDAYGSSYDSYVCEIVQPSGVLGACDTQEIK